MRLKALISMAASLSFALCAPGRVEKPAPDVFFLPLSQQSSGQNVWATDGTQRCWFYVAGSLLSAADTASRINGNPGRFDGTYAFKGSSDAGTALKQVAGSLSEMQYMTVAAWLNYNPSAHIAKATALCAYQGFYLNLDDGSSWGAEPDAVGRRYICFTEFNVIEYGWRSKEAVLRTNEWHHVAVALERDGAWTKPTVYLDGEEVEMEDDGTVGSPTRTAPASISGKSLYIGNCYSTVDAGTRPFDGLVSDIRMYSSLLTSEQVVMLTKSDAELNHVPPEVSLSSNAQSGHVTNTVEATANAVSSNPDPLSALTYSWRRVSGPGKAWFDSPSGRSSTVVFSAPGLYVLECTVSDGVFSTRSPSLSLQVDSVGKLPHPDIFFPVLPGSIWSDDGSYYLFRYGNSSYIMDDGSGRLSGTRALQFAGAAGECYALVCGSNDTPTPFQANPQAISVAAWVDGEGMENSAVDAWLVGKYNVFATSLYKGAQGTSWPVDDAGGKWYVKFEHGRTDDNGNKGMGFKTWCTTSPVAATNGWMHVAATFCRTNGWNAVPRVWIDGVEAEMSVFTDQTTGTPTVFDYGGTSFLLGNCYSTVAAGVKHFGGKMSDVRIMFREIGDGEAKRLAGHIPKKGLVLVFQ